MSYVTDKFDNEIVRLIKSGAVGFMPSDTIYGLSCLARSQSAVERLHKIKDRTSHKPFIILFSDYEQLTDIGVDKADLQIVRKYWPGSLTLVASAPTSPWFLHLGHWSLAIRLPGNEDLLKLIKAAGPIISTSANYSGQEALADFDEARAAFGEQLDFYVDKGRIEGQPSTIVELKDGKLKLLRQGAVKIEQKEQ